MAINFDIAWQKEKFHGEKKFLLWPELRLELEKKSRFMQLQKFQKEKKESKKIKLGV